jgi:hypothetical protein
MIVEDWKLKMKTEEELFEAAFLGNNIKIIISWIKNHPHNRSMYLNYDEAGAPQLSIRDCGNHHHFLGITHEELFYTVADFIRKTYKSEKLE